MEVEINMGNDMIKIKADISKDGNMWCVLAGRNLQEGLAGFGKTINEAILNFKDEFRNT